MGITPWEERRPHTEEEEEGGGEGEAAAGYKGLPAAGTGPVVMMTTTSKDKGNSTKLGYSQ
jgi:hypothetical protein